jgi:aryl-alcohol dehydrogenase-like predicted oxidoreductase
VPSQYFTKGEETMQYRKLGNSELECSVIGLGAWGLADSSWGEQNDENGMAIIQEALKNGINFIDTAQPYGMGKSEQIIGQAVKGIDRKSFILADKCGSKRVGEGQYERDWRPATIRAMLEQSLKDLDMDYIDLYQMHWPSEDSPLKDAFIEMNKFIEEGLVRYVGVSNFSPEQMQEAAQYCPIVSLQPPYSLLDRRIENDIMPYCVEHNIGIVSYGSIAAGALTGKYKERPVYPASDPRGRLYTGHYSEENWPKTQAMVGALSKVAEKHSVPVVHVAIGWVLAQRGMTVAICGARTVEQVRMNAAAGDFVLPAEDDAYIKEEYNKIYG